MLKILVANQNGKQNLEYCKFLENKNRYDVQSSTDAITTFKNIQKIEPNILILDSNFNDTKYTELIDKGYSFTKWKNKCNIILTIDSVQQVLELKNFTKIKQILYKPINYNELIKVNLMKEEFEIKIYQMTNWIITYYHYALLLIPMAVDIWNLQYGTTITILINSIL